MNKPTNKNVFQLFVSYYDVDIYILYPNWFIFHGDNMIICVMFIHHLTLIRKGSKNKPNELYIKL